MARVLMFGLPHVRRITSRDSLLPELLPNGERSANSARTERYRRLLVQHHRDGLLTEIAGELARDRGRLFRESETKVPLSVDLLLEEGARLPVEERRRLATDLALQLGLNEPLWRVGGLDGDS